jgi:hypothetical protein
MKKKNIIEEDRTLDNLLDDTWQAIAEFSEYVKSGIDSDDSMEGFNLMNEGR